MASPDQILQVFWNLTRNALEAMPAGGTLWVKLASRDEEVVLSFRDQGRGMGDDERRRVFEPFQSGSPMGTGIGLAIVYRIVREHSGDITVRSVPARGTEVDVRLPLIAVPAVAFSPAAVPDVASNREEPR
jgi:two-component system sensor histidine kinase PilS (NtrC family)